MSKLVKALLGAVVLVACASGGLDQGTPVEVASVELAVVAPTALPSGMGNRLTKTCSASFPAGVERMLFGASGAPQALKGPKRVVPAGSGAPPRVVGTAIPIPTKPEHQGRVATIEVGARANGSSTLTSPDGTMQIAVALRGAKSVAAQASDGLVVYPGGHDAGDVVVRPREDGAEDWLLLTRPPPGGSIAYDVTLTKGVAAVRKVENTVELLDAGGVPRLRMAPPSLVDDDCQTVPVDVTVTGCTVESSAEPPRGKPHPAPAAPSCRVSLSWRSAGVKYPAALDPVWSSTTSMSVPRAWHTATKLPGGDNILVAGGLSSPGYVVQSSAEVYDATAGVWVATGSMATARYTHGASAFSDGAVIVAGGLDGVGAPTGSVEIYAGGTWTTKAPLAAPVAGNTVDVFAGDWVYIGGGYVSAFGTLYSTAVTAAYYRPGNFYASTPAFASTRGWHSSVVGSDGIYFFGGEQYTGGATTYLSNVDRYVWGSNVLASHAAMPVARSKAGAAAFSAGASVLVAGGENGSGAVDKVSTAPVPGTSSWTARPVMPSGRVWGKVAVRSTGPIVTGGYAGSTVLGSVTLYERPEVAFAGPAMGTARYAHTATALSDDRVIVAGGVTSTGYSTTSVEVLTPDTCTTPAECDDGNPCTDDACVANRCTNVAKPPAAVCNDDGNACNGVNTCGVNGVCSQTTNPVDQPCGTCDPATGAVATKPSGSICASPAGSCQVSARCNGAGVTAASCIGLPAPDGTACGGDLCGSGPNGPRVCRGGDCKVATAGLASLQSSDPCTTTTCDSARGLVTTRTPGCGVENPAPPAPTGLPTTFAETTEFLTQQGGQTGVVLDPQRRAVLRGYVRALDTGGVATNTPVTVAVKGHAGWGSTASLAADGAWALAVEGGGDLVVTFSAPGYITAERQVRTKWNRYTVLDDVALVAREPAHTVTISPTAYTFASGAEHGGGLGQNDGNAKRTATVFFPPNATGQNLPGSTFDLRITEVTGFRSGPRAMPATLPPASGYTYAVDVSVDGVPEGTDIVWNAPNVPVMYVDNFLGLTTGTVVPVGYYDRAKSAWVAEQNGVVVQITGYAGGLATVLGANLSTAERQALATKYAPSTPKSLWRVTLPHFSMWDYNWGFTPPADASPPPMSKNDDGPKPDAPECKGSILECVNRVLGEDIPIAGTPYSLHYRSDRASKANRTVRIPLTEGSLPVAQPTRIDVEIEVAGQRHLISRTPPYDLWDTLEWTWDGKDAFGSTLDGSAIATVKVKNVYAGVLGTTASFGQFPSGTLNGNRERREIYLENYREIVLGGRDAAKLGFGGWMFSPQGMRDEARRVYLTGEGRRVAVGNSAALVAGNGSGSNTDGAPALGSQIANYAALAVSGAGKLYWYDSGRIRALEAGVLQTIAGGGPCPAAWGPGQVDIASNSLCLGYVSAMAFGPDGSLYAVENGTRLLRITPEPGGTTTRLAGREDGAPRNHVISTPTLATTVGLRSAAGLAFDVDGTVLLAELGEITRLGADNKLVHVGGQGTTACSFPPSVATFHPTGTCLAPTGGMAVSPEGDIYLSEAGGNGAWVRALRPSGRIERVLGALGGAVRGGASATATRYYGSGLLAWSEDGLVYSEPNIHQVRRVSPDGYVRELAGWMNSTTMAASSQNDLNSGPDAWSANTLLSIHQNASPIAFAPSGDLYALARRRMGSVFIERITDRTPYSVPLGSVVHVLDGAGRHISTKSRERGITLETLGYTDGLLSSVTDAEGRTTTITRAGDTVTIQAPDGKVTTLALTNGYLDTVTGPDAAVIDVTHDEGGLLTHYVDRRGKAHDFVYDAQGRLSRDRGPDSPPEGGQTLEGSFANGTGTVVHRTAQGRVKVWELSRGPTETAPQLLERLTVKHGMPGAQEVTTQDSYADMKEVVSYPDGRVQTVEQEPDPEYGVMGKVSTRTTVKASPTKTLVSTHAMVKQPNGSFTETTVRQSDMATTTREYNASNAKETRTSAEQRETTTLMDPAKERPTAVQVGPASGGNPQLFPVVYEYVPSGLAAGKILRVTVGTRVTEYAYDAAGELQSITKPTGVTTFDLRDAVGRVTQLTMPGSRVLQTTYDGEGNAVSVIPPGGMSHGFGYSDAGPLASYTAPAAGATPRTTEYTYDQDELLANVTSTDARYNKTVTRDGLGRVTGVQWGMAPPRILAFTYANGHETSANVTSSGMTLSRTYDGSLLSAETQKVSTTATPVTLSRTYDTSLRLAELKLTEGSNEEKLTHGYDKDDLVTSLRRTGASNANSLMLTRSTTAGFLMAADIGTPTILREEVTYDGWGAPTEIRGKWGGAGMGQIGLTYDAAGRVVQKIEAYAFPVAEPAMPNMSNETWSYTYDAAGRLESATEIPSAPRVYTYDARGNRNVTVVDEQDRATQVGAPGQPDYTFYTYDAHGNVATRIVGGTTHTYTWDGEGSLLGVAGTTPGTITYDVDAKGRRVGKRVNGTLERQWMYDGQLRIVAEVVHTPVVRYRVYGYVPERHLPVLMLEKVSGAETQYRIYGDHLGSLRAVVRVSDGKAIQTMRHGPWGEVEDDSVANTFSRVPFGFAGGIYDEVTGLVRFGAREYDARTGRWLSKDELRFEGGDNFYQYSLSDSVNRIDPSGKVSKRCLKKISDGCKDGCSFAADPSLCRFVCLIYAVVDQDYGAGGYCDDDSYDNAKDKCIKECRDDVLMCPTTPKTGHDFEWEYTKCINACMARYGFVGVPQ